MWKQKKLVLVLIEGSVECWSRQGSEDIARLYKGPCWIRLSWQNGIHRSAHLDALNVSDVDVGVQYLSMADGCVDVMDGWMGWSDPDVFFFLDGNGGVPWLDLRKGGSSNHLTPGSLLCDYWVAWIFHFYLLTGSRWSAYVQALGLPEKSLKGRLPLFFPSHLINAPHSTPLHTSPRLPRTHPRRHRQTHSRNTTSLP